MPRVFDNIESRLLPFLQETLKVSQRADFCVGYFNLRGWQHLAQHIDSWSGIEENYCRLLVGMHRSPQEELKDAMRISPAVMDQQTILLLKKKLAGEFREQLMLGIPNNKDESALRKLVQQLREQKVRVKLFLRFPLHAKLYLLFRDDLNNPVTGFVGSSNLTFSGLSGQGELNVDVLEHDACLKLSKWFEDRWNDRWCVDISQELIAVIEESWAREELLPPYYIYVKMAYHLSREARAGLSEFSIPREFGDKLFEFQKAAVKIAAHHVNKRNGVLIGDVVGLGKTLMATALAKIFQDDYGLETLIICPKNLVKMWEDYAEHYRLLAKVLSVSQVQWELPELRRYRLVLIDESHNLRNREGKRYKAIQEYIEKNDSKCILLSATPYNKTFLDLSNQLRLFVPENHNLNVRPEKLLHELGEPEFYRRHQCPPNTLAAFEKSAFADDWRELMRLYMVRRTRTFIQDNYAHQDPDNGRKYLEMQDGTRSYFPERRPKTIVFASEQDHQYSSLFSNEVLIILNQLTLPRYGLANYISTGSAKNSSPQEKGLLDNLSRAGKQLMGFCRTNLLKRLESSGWSFLLSLERHVLRNYIFLHALENGLPLPIGTQEAEMLDTDVFDQDLEVDNDQDVSPSLGDEESEKNMEGCSPAREVDFQHKAKHIYQLYETRFKNRFKWIRTELFVKNLAKDLQTDSRRLLEILNQSGSWRPETDSKLNRLYELLADTHINEKVLIFTQFADTAFYLESQLKLRGLAQVASVTGDSDDPTLLAWQFSPRSNEKMFESEQQVRVLIATDVLSEGQNLQDCSVIINYDLPWAIIRLIQRAGRVDRIGQQAEQIVCYSFLPAEGVEAIIRLRDRVKQRLKENAEVVGTDESFFEDEGEQQALVDLYNEKSGVLDGEADAEVDLASYAYQIWKNALDSQPELLKLIPQLPDLVFSAKNHTPTAQSPSGVLVYMHGADGSDALAWVDSEGNNVTESQFTILKAARCLAETPARLRSEEHHELVLKGIEVILRENRYIGGQLGRPSGARSRIYERLKHYANTIQDTLFEGLLPELKKALDDIYKYPLTSSATDTLNRQLRSCVSDHTLAELVSTLREEARLCQIPEEGVSQEPRIICSLGLQA